MSESINTQDTDIAVSYKKGWEVAVGRLEEIQTSVIQLASLKSPYDDKPSKGAVYNAEVNVFIKTPYHNE